MLQNPWIVFVLSAAIVVVAAIKLAQYGDVIAVRTGLGGLWSAPFSWRPPLRCQNSSLR